MGIHIQGINKYKTKKYPFFNLILVLSIVILHIIKFVCILPTYYYLLRIFFKIEYCILILI